MKKSLGLSLIMIVASTGAQAESYNFECTRYKSQCVGKTCYDLAEGMKADTEKKILSLKNLEQLHYAVTPGSASETALKGEELMLTKRKYQMQYKQIEITPALITLANLDTDGSQKERITIEPMGGFYAYYILHTDGSIKDVPIGEPYRAYFGWCVQPQTPPAPVSTVPDVVSPAPIAPTTP